MNLRAFASMTREALSCFDRDRGWDLAGNISFFLSMALVGGAVLTTYVAGLLHDGEAIITSYMKILVGPHAAGMFADLLARANTNWTNLIAVAVVLVIFLWSAGHVLERMHQAMNAMLGVAPSCGEKWVVRLALWGKRILSSVLVVSSGLLLTISFSLKTTLELFDYFGISPVSENIWWFRAVEVVVALGMATVLCAWLFRVMPDAKVPKNKVWHGAFLAAKLYMAVQIVTSFAVVYLGGLSYYGEAAILLLLLAYLYFSMVSFFLGVEFLRVQFARESVDLRPASFAQKCTPGLTAPAAAP